MKLLLAILAVLLCSGCFVLEEIDKGHEIMKAHDGIDNEAEESGEGVADAKGPPKTSSERLAEYYAKQRARASAPTKSEDASDKLGQCRIGGSTRFMRRSDCQTRGGKFL